MKKSMQNKILSMLLVFVLIIGTLPASVLATDQPALTDPATVEIGTAEELLALAGQELTGNYCLTKDIDMTGKAMQPIKKLIGNFNGNGHTIANLTIQSEEIPSAVGDALCVGLFGRAIGSISDLRLLDANICCKAKSNVGIGGLVGVVDSGELNLTNCVVTGIISGPDNAGSCYAGGLVGDVLYGTSKLTVTNCFSAANVKVGTAGGGLIGRAGFMANVGIKDCAVTGTIQAKIGGGIIGYCFMKYNISAENCYFMGDFTGEDTSNLYVFGYSNGKADAAVHLTNCAYDSRLGENRPAIKEGNGTLTGTMESKTTQELETLTKDILAWPKSPSGGSQEEVVPDTKISVTPEKAELKVYKGTDETGTLMEPKQDPSYGNYIFTLEKGDYYYTAQAHDYTPISGTFTVTTGDNKVTIALTKIPGWTEKASQAIAVGDGTVENPYQISSPEELACFANKVNSKESAAHACLMADIDLQDLPWKPIGENSTTSFQGVFDGQNHTISGLNVSREAGRYFGFFGCIENATVKNVTICGSIYDAERGDRVGGLTGHAKGDVLLQNCANLCNISSGAGNVGGLVGDYDKGVEYQTPTVRLLLERCYNAGNIVVTGSDTSATVGGLVGGNKNCVQMKDCYNVGAVRADKMQAGGLLGNAGSTTGDYTPSLTNCYNAGIVTSNSSSHAIYGKGFISGKNLINCYAINGSGAQQKDIIFLEKDDLTAALLGSGWAQDPEKNDGLPYLSDTTPGLPDDTLLNEAAKYADTVSVAGTCKVGDSLMLLKEGMTADETIELRCIQTIEDKQYGYLSCEGSTMKLKKANETAEAMTETATLCFTKEGVSFNKPISIIIYPATEQSGTLMEKIAASYVEKSDEWVIFDMAVYAQVHPDAVSKTSDIARKSYQDLTIEQKLVKNTEDFELLTNEIDTRTKGEIILGTLGVDTTALCAFPGTNSEITFSNAARLAAAVDGLKSHYSAPWVLLAAQQGKTNLTPAQVQAMVKLLSDNQQENGLNCYQYYGKTYDDVDTTATALAAFASYYLSETDDYGVKQSVNAFVEKALDGMSKAQQNNGSFGNVNTDAMAIIGLTALGIDPASDSRFVKDGCSLAAALSLYVNENADGYRSGMATGKPEEIEKANALATEQGFRAMVALDAFQEDTTKAYNIYTQQRTALPDSSVSQEISVSFTLKQNPEQEPWIPTTSFTMTEGSTAYDLIGKALEDNHMTFTEKDGYIDSVTKDGKTVKAGDDGPNSGWMYDVNGKLPTVPTSGYVLENGDAVEFFYVVPPIEETVATPVISPESGSFVESQSITIRCETAGAEIFYTTDGSAPTSSAIRYTGPFEIRNNTVIKAIAVKAGMKNSAVASAEYTVAEFAVCLASHLENGEVQLSTNQARPGSVVTITAVPAENYVVDTVVVADGSGKLLPLEEKDHNTYTFQMPASDVKVQVSFKLAKCDGGASCPCHNFEDLDTTRWYHEGIDFVLKNNYMNGTTATTFHPNLPANRAMFVTVLYRMAGSPATGDCDLEDVPADRWYTDAVTWATENHIAQGYGNNKFGPKNLLTREQLVTFLYRYAGSPETEGRLDRFQDADLISDYAHKAMQWAVENEIVNGKGSMDILAPTSAATRAEIATIIMRFAAKANNL